MKPHPFASLPRTIPRPSPIAIYPEPDTSRGPFDVLERGVRHGKFWRTRFQNPAVISDIHLISR